VAHHLFTPLRLRDVVMPNRIAVSPMCQYSASDGHPNDWHYVHLASRAIGGAGLVIAEATAVEPRGRITPYDLGIWSDEHVHAFRRLVELVAAAGAVPGIQLAHAGRKASTARPWEGRRSLTEGEGGWSPIVGPSPLPFSDANPSPEPLDAEGIANVTRAFAEAARRSRDAGFRLIEIHAAHGYLLSSFLSPLANRREDEYGGSFENRVRLLEEVVASVRGQWPAELPLLVRISTTDWVEGGWTVKDSVQLAARLKQLGVDLLDCSSGGNVMAPVPAGPGYQTAAAAELRRRAGIMTGAVGMISSPHQADHVIRSGQADLVLLARAILRDPYWPLHAASELGVEVPWPVQYERAKR
jgi:2,4-dienoyl-CoA reductase-like NADH-dependent reductase (Old Yellow Enzyme family)